jgi:DNA-binding NarL/FixJ family response regulator
MCGREGVRYREEQAVSFAVQGLCTREIAEKMFITEKTVSDYLRNYMRKNNYKSRAQMIVSLLKEQNADNK